MENVNVNNYGLTEDEIKAFKAKVAEENKVKNRQETLNKFLNDPENKDVHKELYDKGGLKSLLETDPDILDNQTAFKIALKTSKENYFRKLEDEKKKTETVKIESSAPLTPAGEVKTESKKVRAGSLSTKTLMEKRPGIKTEGEALMVQWFNPNYELDE